MLDVRQRATQARQLEGYEPFKEICAEIREEAVQLFLNPASDITSIARAHEAVRAVETFMATIQTRIDAEKVADKKAQHRGSD
jgi:transposase-like protein